LTHPDWLWIPITVFAAFAQTVRNATQRHLFATLGTLGATWVRFLYGLPFALVWLTAVYATGDAPLPHPNLKFCAWVVASAAGQIAATALLLRVMAERNFALGVAYAKSEVMQVAVFGLVFLGDPVSASLAVAIAFGTLGVLLLSPIDRKHPLRALAIGWTTRVALLGVASGAAFGFAAVGYRGSALALEGAGFVMAGAYTLVAAQLVQTVALGCWFLLRDPGVVGRVLAAWRTSLLAGLMGAAASAAWFTATAIEPAGPVRTLGLIELLFSYVVSRRIFRERLTALEITGIVTLSVGLVIVTLVR